MGNYNKKYLDMEYTNVGMLKFHHQLAQFHDNKNRAPYIGTNGRISSFILPDNAVIEFQTYDSHILKYDDGTPITKFRCVYRDDKTTNVYRVPYQKIIPDLHIKMTDKYGNEEEFWRNIYRWGDILDDYEFVMRLNLFIFTSPSKKILWRNDTVKNLIKCAYMPYSLLRTYTHNALKKKIPSFSLPYVTMNNVYRNINVDPDLGVNGIYIAIPDNYYLMDIDGNIVTPCDNSEIDSVWLHEPIGYSKKYIIPYWIFMKFIEFHHGWVVIDKYSGEKRHVLKEMWPEALMRFKSRVGNIYRWLHIRLDI